MINRKISPKTLYTCHGGKSSYCYSSHGKTLLQSVDKSQRNKTGDILVKMGGCVLLNPSRQYQMVSGLRQTYSPLPFLEYIPRKQFDIDSEIVIIYIATV